MTPPLAVLFARALESASKASGLPTIQDETQELVKSSWDDLNILAVRVSGLFLFSANDTLEDIATKDLLYLLVPYVLSDVRERVTIRERDERMLALRYRQEQLRHFLLTLQNYEIVPRTERSLYEKSPIAIANATERRELKIKQFKSERELRTKIQEVRRRRRQTPTDDDSNDFDLIRSLLPSPTQIFEDDDENVRQATLLLLRLTYAQAYSQLTSISQEMQLLHSMPPPPPEQPSDDQRPRIRESDSTWKLDSSATGPQGPLLDARGKPLRPFTILRSREAADRARLQAQVFGPGYTLPTMSVDEYLEIERRRGMIITDGGAKSAAEPTSSEQLALDSETDGTTFGEQKAEERRLKDENWARFTDENPRGQGNTMNRG